MNVIDIFFKCTQHISLESFAEAVRHVVCIPQYEHVTLTPGLLLYFSLNSEFVVLGSST